MARLRSWMVTVQDANHTSGVDSWGEPTSWRAIRTHYVVARTRRDAVWQAKALAGYVTDKERESARFVSRCQHLMFLDEDPDK